MSDEDEKRERDLAKINDPVLRDLVRGLGETVGADDYQERVRRALEHEGPMRERARRQDLADRGVPWREIPRIMSGSLEGTRAVRVVERWVEQDPRVEGARWFLVLGGAPGTGKTTAAAWATARLSKGRLVHAGEFFSWGRSREESGAKTHGYCNMAFLALDDLGTEALDGGGRDLSMLDRVVDARYAGRRQTIITTNLDEAALYARYGERIARRLREAGAYVRIADVVGPEAKR